VLTRWLPQGASEHAPAVDLLILSVHWLMAALAIGWLLFFLFCLFRFNRRANPVARYRGVPARVAWVIVGAVAVVELAELFFVAIPLWAARVRNVPAARDATVVRVVAEQFAWNVHYPGADGVFGRTAVTLVTPEDPLGIDRSDPAAKDDVTTVNELNFPVGRPVVIHLTSKDVIHSLSLPQMRVKQDAIPGMSVTVWFLPTEVTAGDPWEINCSQLCGVAHYRMRGFYRSMPQQQFDGWFRAQHATPGSNR
jgi:cytochrome c oxidase subunit 2